MLHPATVANHCGESLGDRIQHNKYVEYAHAQ